MASTALYSAASILLGAQQQTNKFWNRIVHTRSLAALWTFLEARLQETLDAGRLTRCDAGEVAPEVLRILQSLAHFAEQQETSIRWHFRAPHPLRHAQRGGPMDLFFAMRGLEQAARVTEGECWALHRQLRNLQYPANGILGATPDVSPPRTQAWADVASIPWLTADAEHAPALAEVAAGVIWLDQLIRRSSAAAISGVRRSLLLRDGERSADPLAVSSAVAESAVLAAFAGWFAHGAAQLTWQISASAPNRSADAEVQES